MQHLRSEETAEQREERLARERDRSRRQCLSREAGQARLDQDRADHQQRRVSETPTATQARRLKKWVVGWGASDAVPHRCLVAKVLAITY